MPINSLYRGAVLVFCFLDGFNRNSPFQPIRIFSSANHEQHEISFCRLLAFGSGYTVLAPDSDWFVDSLRLLY